MRRNPFDDVPVAYRRALAMLAAGGTVDDVARTGEIDPAGLSAFIELALRKALDAARADRTPGSSTARDVESSSGPANIGNA